MKLYEIWKNLKEEIKKIHVPLCYARFFLQYMLNMDSNSFYNNLYNEINLEKEKIDNFLSQLKNNRPFEYIINQSDFMGLKFFVNEDVLIPRSETELMVEYVIEKEKNKDTYKTFLDVGTGSGCIIISLAYYLKKGFFVANDISYKALSIAKKNAKEILTKNIIHFIQTCFFDGIKGKFDYILSNPPYVNPTEEKIEKSVIKYEPHIALFSPEKGLYHIKTILKNAKTFLSNEGLLIIEIGYNQFQKVSKISKNLNYKIEDVIEDYSHFKRHIILKRE